MTDGRLDAGAYDRIAQRWHAGRSEPPAPLRALLDRLLASLPQAPTVLDVGCGSGVPVARHLVRHGCDVTGLDASSALLEIAQRELPEARFIRGDMRDVGIDDRFDAIVAWDAVFHVQREDHALIFTRFAQWLRPQGLLLLSLGGSAWEGTSEMFGETFFYSGHDSSTSRQLLADAGFEVMHWEVDDPTSRAHIAILARRLGA